MRSNIFRPSSKALQPFWEAVTYLPRVPPGAEPTAGYTLYRAKREDAYKEDAPPALAVLNRNWIIFQSDLDQAGLTARPKVGDVLKDADGARWVVKSLGEELEGHSYELRCLKER